MVPDNRASGAARCTPVVDLCPGGPIEPARGSALARLAVELRTLADGGPVAVVRLRWWPVGPVSLAGGGTPLFRFEGLGSEPTVLDVDTPDLRLFAEAPGALPDWFVPAPATPADVMAPDGRLLGGATGPVVIPPGGAGNVAFVGALRPDRAGAGRVHARFRGRIALAGPGQQAGRPAAQVEIASVDGRDRRGLKEGGVARPHSLGACPLPDRRRPPVLPSGRPLGPVP